MTTSHRTRLAAHVREPLFRNGYALILSSGLTSALGMAFWVLAARLFSADAVGVSSALISVSALLATIAQLNLANVLHRFLPVAGRRTGQVLRDCYLVGLVAAVCVGGVFLLGIGWWAPSLAFLAEDPLLATWFVVALALWGLFVLQDGALSGLRHATWVPAKNLAFACAKILLLAVPVLLVSPYAIFLAWTVPLLPVLIVVHVLMVRRLVPRNEQRTSSREQTTSLRRIGRYVAADYLVALAGTGTVSVLPILVLEVSGAAQAAYFSITWSIAYALYLVSRGMATSLLVEGATDATRLSQLSYRATRTTMLLLIPAVAAVVLVAPLVLRIFGGDYAEEGTTVLRLMTLAAIPSTVFAVFAAVERVRGRMVRLVVSTVAINATALALIWVLLPTYGLTGLGLGWLFAQSVAAVLLLLTVLGPMWLNQFDGRVLRWLLRPARAGRELVDARRARRLLQARYAGLARALDLDPSWRIHRVVPTSGDVTVALIGGEVPAAVLKYAHSPSGATALDRADAAVERLAADPRLAGWVELVPRSLGSTLDGEGHRVTLEQLLPGTDGRTAFVADGGPATLDAALAVVEDLHRRTASETLVDERLLGHWVDDPLDVLSAWLPARGSGRDDLQLVGGYLRRGLEGRPVSVGWTHGDVSPGNVLFSRDLRRVQGLVDWEWASATGLADVDVVHLLLTVRMLRERRELGDLVTELLAGAGVPDGDPRLSDPVLVLLTWLHHVAGIVARSDRYAPGALWAARNVEVVLQRVREGCLEGTHPS